LCILGQFNLAVTPFSYAFALGHPKAEKELTQLLARLDPKDRAHSHRILASFYHSNGQLESALQHCRKAIHESPDDTSNWMTFGQILARVRFTRQIDAGLLADISKAFEIKELDHKHIAGAAISALIHGNNISPLRTAFEHDEDPVSCIYKHLVTGALHDLAEDTLFRRVLSCSLINSPEFEHLLTGLRTAILKLHRSKPDSLSAAYLGLICCLSQQCFLNEYIWIVTPYENEVLGQLVEEILDHANRNHPVPAVTLAIVATYQPLYRLPCSAWIHSCTWPESLADVIRMQVSEPLQEQQLRTQIPGTLPVANDVTEQLRTQYEESPYPRWINLPLQGTPILLEDYISRSVPGLTDAERRQPENPRILVAGCGTGLAPNHLAKHIKNATVVAIDLSLNSLAYAKRKSRKLGLENIEYIQGDILNLGMLEQKFDHINCYGVLHHLNNIQQAWRTLTDQLKPNGTMQIGIYSEVAQRPLHHARQFIDQRHYGSSMDDIRRCRQDITHQVDDELLQRLTESPSFYNMSDFRDLIFYYKKSFVTMEQLQEMITALGLQFIGFQHNDPGVNQRYLQRFPQDPHMRSLTLWAQYEKEYPETFSSFYNFWVRKPG